MYEFQRKELDALERVVRDASAEPMILTLPLLRHITKDFSAEFEIGKDESAVVYLGVLPSGFRIAVKKLQFRHDDDAFTNEVTMAMKAGHKNTVRLIGFCYHTQEQIVEYEGKQVFAEVRERLICTEYVPDGTLSGHIEGKIYTEMNGYEFQRVELDALERVVRDASAEPMSLTLPLLRHITNDFSPESEIGQGAYAVVYLGVLPSGLRIAVKSLHNTLSNEESVFQNEVFITMKTAHKNTVRLIGYCADMCDDEAIEHDGKIVMATRTQMFICLEYVPNGTLEMYITGKFRGRLDWNQSYQILKGICQGLRHLHDEVHVFHGDIKPENILIGDNLVPKLYDFGLSRSIGERDSGYDPDIRGTIGYMAPEMINEGFWSIKSDIFSLGTTIIELLTAPIMRWEWEKTVEQVLTELRKSLVKDGAFTSWENKYHQVRTCLEIGYNCMEMDRDRRPTALEIIQRLDETENTNYSDPSLWQGLCISYRQSKF